MNWVQLVLRLHLEKQCDKCYDASRCIWACIPRATSSSWSVGIKSGWLPEASPENVLIGNHNVKWLSVDESPASLQRIPCPDSPLLGTQHVLREIALSAFAEEHLGSPQRSLTPGLSSVFRLTHLQACVGD